jgi:xylulose-5-phosphate/fructose-6-phosphate phosphoketolase
VLRTASLNHANSSFKEEGTTTTPFHMTMLNKLDRYRLAGDVIDRVPPLLDRSGSWKWDVAT